MKKILIFILAFLIAGAGGYYWWTEKRGEPAEKNEQKPETVVVETGDLRIVVEATGRVVPDQTVEIKCKASGEVVELPFDVSDPVNKGDLLVQLDTEDEERSVKRAETALTVSRAKLHQAELQLLIAEKDLASERIRALAALTFSETKQREAESRIKRIETLFARKMVSREEVEVAKSAADLAESELQNALARVKDLETEKVRIDSLKEDIKIAASQVTVDEIALEDARQRLDETRVTAPIDGVVAQSNVQTGQIIASGVSNVGGGTTVMTVMDLSKIYVLVSVDESDIGRIQTGLPARITVDAHPDTRFRGEVVRVATQGVSVSNVVTFEVKVEVKGPRNNMLKPEMTANVEITAVDKTNLLLLPVQAVERRRGEAFVIVRTADGEFERKQIAIGMNDGVKVEIKDGLNQGEIVLTPGKGAQSRWRKDTENGRNPARKDRMRMRSMGGGARK